MRENKLKRLVDAISGLSASELATIKDVVERRERVVDSEIFDSEMSGYVKECPHCRSKEFTKAGSHKGRKRYLCKSCGKSFNALTGTPLAGLHNTDKFMANARHMIAGDSVRKTAADLGLDKDTAFRWRHRFLESIDKIQPAQLQGVVEADETYFLESFKGQRGSLPRKAKKRGTPAKKRGLSKEQIPVLVARNRADGATLTAVLPSQG